MCILVYQRVSNLVLPVSLDSMLVNNLPNTLLSNGIFANQKSRYWFFVEGLEMETVCIFYGYMVNVRPFVNFYDHLVYFVVIEYIFYRCGILYQKNIWQP
jgi:hypothetical protein